MLPEGLLIVGTLMIPKPKVLRVAAGVEPTDRIKLAAEIVPSPFGKNFKEPLLGMVAPDQLPYPNQRRLLFPLHRDPQRGSRTIRTIKPTIRPPGQRIRKRMGIFNPKASQMNLRRSVGLIITVLVLVKKKIRRLKNPQPIMTVGKACAKIKPIEERGHLVKRTITIGILVDANAVFSGNIVGVTGR